LNVSTLGGGAAVLNTLSYYTLQSNIVVLVFFVAWLIYSYLRRDRAPSARYYTIKGGVIVCIALTLLVFHFMLRPTMFAMGGGDSYLVSPANLIVHYVVPLMTLADWLLFDKKGQFRRLDPIKWLLIPLAYLIFALVRAQFATFGSGSRYPYFFMDIDKYGVGQVAINCLFITFGLLVLGYVIYLVDLGLSKIPWWKKKSVR
jgi:hypothetical protein